MAVRLHGGTARAVIGWEQQIAERRAGTVCKLAVMVMVMVDAGGDAGGSCMRDTVQLPSLVMMQTQRDTLSLSDTVRHLYGETDTQTPDSLRHLYGDTERSGKGFYPRLLIRALLL